MNGFSLFDSTHLIWLIISIIFTVTLLFIYKNFHPTKRPLLQKSLFFSLLFLEISKQLIFLLTNSYTYWSPPLHLCGLGIFIIGWHCFSPNKVTAEILFTLTLPGAIAALLLPGWTYEPVWRYVHINSFLFHILLISYVVNLLFTKEISPSIKRVYYPILFLLVITPPIYVYNKVFQTNFMFINWPIAGTPLSLFAEWFGIPGYLFGFAFLLFTVWLIMYTPFILKRKRALR